MAQDTQSTAGGERVGRRVLVANSLPAVILAALGFSFYVYLPKFYADVVHVNLTALGVIVLLSRGGMRSSTRWWGSFLTGRGADLAVGAPWIAAGVLPLLASTVLLFVPPSGLSSGAAAAWLAVSTFLFFLFWTVVTVPYEALGAELSFDYDERTRLLGLREGGVIVGTLLAAILPALLVGVAAGGADRLLLRRLAVIYGVLLVVLVGCFLWVVRERRTGRLGVPASGVLQSWQALFGNRPFRILLVAYTISAFGSQLPATLILFYVEHVLGSGNGPLFLVLYLGAGFLFLPAWIALAKRLEKRSTLMIAMGINTGAFLAVLFLGPGDAAIYMVLVVVSAVGLGGVVALPASMLADVIDYDEWRYGERREGQFVGGWNVCRKLAAAVGAGLAFPILDAAGYESGAVQPIAVSWVLRILYAAVPCCCNLAALLVLKRYPIDRSLHRVLREEIAGRGRPPSSGQ